MVKINKILLYSLMFLVLTSISMGTVYYETHGDPLSSASGQSGGNQYGIEYDPNTTSNLEQLGVGSGSTADTLNIYYGGNKSLIHTQSITPGANITLSAPVKFIASKVYYIMLTKATAWDSAYKLSPSFPYHANLGTIPNSVYYEGGWSTATSSIQGITAIRINDTIIGGGVPPVVNSNIPRINENFNSNPINFTADVNLNLLTNCTLYLDGILNETTNNIINTTTQVSYLKNITSVGQHFYNITCVDSVGSDSTGNITFYYDTINPNVITDYVNNSVYYTNLLTGSFNLSDNIILDNFVISVDNVFISNLTGINSTFYHYNLSYDITNLTIGLHNLSVELRDGHTAKKLKDKDAYKFGNGLFNNIIDLDVVKPYKSNNIRISQKDGSIFDRFSTSFNGLDRYTFNFKPNNKKGEYTFIVESDEELRVLSSGGLYGGAWFVTGEQWIDFYSPSEIGSYVSNIKFFGNNKAEITISGINPNSDVITFNSIGDVNIINVYYTFNKVNASVSYSTDVASRQSQVINLTIDYGVINDYNSSGILYYNSTLYTGVLTSYDTKDVYSYTLTTPNVTTQTNLSFYWNFSIETPISYVYNTSSLKQTIHNPLIDKCSFYPYPVINISYFDELTDLPITASNNYALSFDNGYNIEVETGTFASNYNHSFCTNTAPQDLVYNWNVYGTMSLSSSSYVTRVMTYDSTDPFSVSNSPVTQQKNYLIGIANSSTITFNWLTTTYQLVDGLMYTYRCNGDGSKTLVESNPITGGVSVGNLKLLTELYSFKVLYNGLIYSDDSDYSRCHVETDTSATYYIDTGTSQAPSIVGLDSIICSFEKTTDTTATMTWTANPEVEGYVSGCIVGYLTGVTGTTEIYNNCTSEGDGYTRTINVPVDSNNYILQAKLVQGLYEVPCDNQLVYNNNRDPTGLFSGGGIIATFLILVALVLMFSGNGERMIIGVVIGLIASFLLGVYVIDWLGIISMIAYLGLLLVIGRYGRSN